VDKTGRLKTSAHARKIRQQMGDGRVAVTGTDRTTVRATMATSRQSKHTERKVDERGRRKGNFDEVCTFFFTL
jgi:hypothetical protein